MSTLEFCRRIRYLHRFCGQHLMYLSVYLWSRDDGPLLMDTQYVFGASRYCRYAQNLYWSLGYFVVCHNYNWLPRTYPYCLYNSFRAAPVIHSVFESSSTCFPVVLKMLPLRARRLVLVLGIDTKYEQFLSSGFGFLCNTIHANLAIWNIVDPWTRQGN